MYKTIRHGENSLQYTILPQHDDATGQPDPTHKLRPTWPPTMIPNLAASGDPESGPAEARIGRRRCCLLFAISLLLVVVPLATTIVGPAMLGTTLQSASKNLKWYWDASFVPAETTRNQTRAAVQMSRIAATLTSPEPKTERTTEPTTPISRTTSVDYYNDRVVAAGERDFDVPADVWPNLITESAASTTVATTTSTQPSSTAAAESNPTSPKQASISQNKHQQIEEMVESNSVEDVSPILLRHIPSENRTHPTMQSVWLAFVQRISTVDMILWAGCVALVLLAVFGLLRFRYWSRLCCCCKSHKNHHNLLTVEAENGDNTTLLAHNSDDDDDEDDNEDNEEEVSEVES